MKSARCHGVLTVLTALLAIAWLVALPVQSAHARHELDLAKGLAFDFEMFDLAREILVGKDGTPDNPGGEMKKAIAAGDKKYQEEITLALYSILLRQALAEPERGDKLKSDAGAWVQKYAGQGTGFWAAKLEEANTLAYECDREADPDKKAALKQRAIEAFTACAAGYRQVRDGLFAAFNDSKLKDPAQIEELKLSWYYWCQCLFELSKLGDNKTENLKTIANQLDEMMFEWGDEFIGYYCMLLKGDGYTLGRQWGKAESEYTGVLGLPLTIPGIAPEGQKALDSLRMQAYHKLALALLAQNNHERLVSLITKMFTEYPNNKAKEIKLCRLLRAESQVQLLLEGTVSQSESLQRIRKVIDDLAPFATDPDAFFRFKYYEMLANIGRSPGLDLDLRLRCGRAAYDSYKFKEAAEIYQQVLTSLRVVDRGGRLDKDASKKNFERYAPEAYWRLGEAFSQQWRFFEAGYVYYRAAQQFQYFSTTYKDADKLPAHMMEGDSPFFEGFDNMQKVAAFPLELAKKAKMCIAMWSPGGRDPAAPAASPRAMPHSVEANWINNVNQLERQIEAEVGDKAKVERELFSDIWKIYSAQFENEKGRRDYDYHEAISGFATIKPIIGFDLYYSSFNFCADLMRRQAALLDGRTGSELRNKIRDPFPETVRENEGKNLYEYEKERIESREMFGRLPDNHRANLIDMLNHVLDAGSKGWKVADGGQPDYRLLYWYKARYFILRLFYLMLDRRYDDINNADPKIWSRSIGQVLGMWSTLSNQEAQSMDPAAAGKIRERVRDIAFLVWHYGVLIRTSPWSQPPSQNPQLTGWLYVADGGEKEAECKRIDNEFKDACLDLWRDYSNNFGPAFTDPEPARKAELTLQFKSLERGLLYLSFYLHIRKRNPVAAENVMQAFSLAFPAQEEEAELAKLTGTLNPQQKTRKEMIEQNIEWRRAFTQTLAQTFEAVNWDENNLFSNAQKNLVPNIAKLRGSDKISLKDLERSISDYVIFCWIESATGNNIVCPDEEALMYNYLAHYVLDSRGVTFIREQGGVDRDALNEYLDRPENAAIGQELFRDVDGMRRYRESHNDFFEQLKNSDRDIVHLDRNDLLEVLKGRDGTPPNVEMLDLDLFSAEAQKKMTELAKADNFEGMIEMARIYAVDLRPQVRSTKPELPADELESNKAFNEEQKDYPPVLRLAHTVRINALPAEVQAKMVDAATRNADDELKALCKQHGVDLAVPGKADSKLRLDSVKGRLATGSILTGQKYADEIGQMYGGYQTQVFLDRYKVADALEQVSIKYTQSIIRLDRKALSYYARYWEWERKNDTGKWNAKEYYDQGRRFFQAELWDQAIEYMEPILDQIKKQVKTEPKMPWGITVNNRAHRNELPLRYYVGRAYYEKAILSGKYDGNDPNWKQVDEHFERIYQFVQFRNIERQKGNNAPIIFESILDEWYYPFLERLAKYYELKAQYLTQAKKVKEAADAWIWAISVHYLIFKQSPKYSPDERMAKYEQCRIFYTIALLDKAYDQYIKECLKVFNSEYRGRAWDDPGLVLHGDPEYDRAMDTLYPKVLKLARERGIIK